MRRLLVALALALTLGACGDRSDAPPAPDPAAAAPEPAEAAEPPPPPPPREPAGLAPAPEWSEPAASESGRPSLLLLGIDGAEWRVLDVLFDAGYLPNLARLAREGTRAALDCTPAMPETACLSTPVWISIATGVPQQRHGVSTANQEAGERAAPALWSVLHARGGTSTLVAFRNTWPPEPSARYVLTEDGLDWAATQIYERLPLEKPELRQMLVHQRFAPEDLLERVELLPHEGAKPPLWKGLARDRVAMDALLQLAPRDRTDLTILLVHAADRAQHLGWGAVQAAPESPFDASALLAQARAWEGPVASRPSVPGFDVASQYLEVDRFLGRLLSRVGYHYVAVASGHGMARNPGEGLPGSHGPEAPEAHRGVWILWGAGVREGARLEGVDVFDVAPTLAHLLELPVAGDLPGEVMLDAFTPAWRDAHPVQRVAAWDQPKTPESTSTPAGQ